MSSDFSIGGVFRRNIPVNTGLDRGSTSVGQDMSGTSLMNKIAPNKNFQAAPVNTDNLKRSSDNINAGDLSAARQQASSARQDVNRVQADFKQSYETAQNQVRDAIAETAIEKGVEPGLVFKSIVRNTGTTGTEAGVSLGINAATSGIANIAEMLYQFVDERKLLKPGEIEALVEEAQQRLVSNQKQQSVVTTAQSSESAPQQETAFNFEDTTPRDLIALVQTPADQQPEMKTLANIEEQLSQVDDNHMQLQEYLDRTPDMNLALQYNTLDICGDIHIEKAQTLNALDTLDLEQGHIYAALDRAGLPISGGGTTRSTGGEGDDTSSTQDLEEELQVAAQPPTPLTPGFNSGGYTV